MSDQLAAAVVRFRGEHPACLDPELIYDRCQEVSAAFAALLADVGVAASVVSGMQFDVQPDGRILIHRGHFAVQVGQDVYDWTARQFAPGAPVPQVMPLPRWRETWKPLPAAR
ncbi:hypothetical protein [Streptacidiphilus sp. EB129]|uniref:hypothetical protein n=1 Tax=Streptacidiphilus sp. EB129 TaxID=3156262 RepID=UPI003518B3E8